MDNSVRITDDEKKDKLDKRPLKEGILSSVICHPPTETGGPKGPEPTRYGDWEIGGKCVDF